MLTSKPVRNPTIQLNKMKTRTVETILQLKHKRMDDDVHQIFEMMSFINKMWDSKVSGLNRQR